jgi:small-conductance mechanosensitive channel
MSDSIRNRQMYMRVMPMPYLVSLVFRWVVPKLVRRGMNRRRRRGKDKEGAKENCIKRWCVQNQSYKIPYLLIISVFIRLSALFLLLNFALKLTNIITWSYYIILWPYYIFLGMSLVFSCGTLLLLFNWLCMKVNNKYEVDGEHLPDITRPNDTVNTNLT